MILARHDECTARAYAPSLPDVLNPQSLHRWLRKTALAAVPILGLTGCDDCTETSNYMREGYLPPDAGWVVGSVHSSAECSPYCPNISLIGMARRCPPSKSTPRRSERC